MVDKTTTRLTTDYALQRESYLCRVIGHYKDTKIIDTGKEMGKEKASRGGRLWGYSLR